MKAAQLFSPTTTTIPELTAVLLQLQAAIEAEFQEKFQRLPGEIQDFLQDRKMDGRSSSKSRPSTPHETLSEAD